MACTCGSITRVHARQHACYHWQAWQLPRLKLRASGVQLADADPQRRQHCRKQLRGAAERGKAYNIPGSQLAVRNLSHVRIRTGSGSQPVTV